jgi:hypothetical protein
MRDKLMNEKLDLTFAELRVLDAERALRHGGYPHTKPDSKKEVYIGHQEVTAPRVTNSMLCFSRRFRVLPAAGMGDGCNPRLGSKQRNRPCWLQGILWDYRWRPLQGFQFFRR